MIPDNRVIFYNPYIKRFEILYIDPYQKDHITKHGRLTIGVYAPNEYNCRGIIVKKRNMFMVYGDYKMAREVHVMMNKDRERYVNNIQQFRLDYPEMFI